MDEQRPRRVAVGRGGCWWEPRVCNAKAVPGGYYCETHIGRVGWDMDRVVEGGDTGKVLLNRHPTSDPDLEGGAGRGPS